MLGKRSGWLGFATLYAALLIIPVLLYVFVYQESRIDQATMRNFRALEAAAKRIEEVLKTVSKVAVNSSLGVDQELLEDIRDLCPSGEPCNPGSKVDILDANVRKAVCPNEEKSCNLYSEVAKAADNLHELVRSHKSKLNIKTDLSRLKQPNPTENSGGDKSAGEVECRNGKNFIKNGKLVSHDCRPLRERNKQLYDALKKTEAVKALIDVLDSFGVKISMPVNDVFDDATRHLSMFFDNHFVADANGQVIFHGDPLRSGHDTLQPLGVRAPFAGFAKITDILAEPAAKSVIPYSASTQAPQVEAPSKSRFTHAGHSIVRSVHVDDVELSVFIHPFSIDKPLAYDLDDPKDHSSMLYIVGVVRQNSLASEAIRLRLGTVVDATLVIATLLAFLPIFRFWAAGDRSILGCFGLYGIGASAIGASALGTALVWGVVTKHSDGAALDSWLVHISKDIRDTFQSDLTDTIEALEADVICMSNKNNCKAGIAKPKISGEVLHTSFWCPPSLESKSLPSPDEFKNISPVWCPRDLPEYGSSNESAVTSIDDLSEQQGQHHSGRLEVSFLLEEKGMMESCKSYRYIQTPKLDLSFRNYFMNPNKCNVWRLDKSKRDSDLKALNGFFLERIDSVVQGTKEVVVSYPLVQAGKEADESKAQEKSAVAENRTARRRVVKVAAAVAQFESLDQAVLPPHFHYAVVENETGKILFHSDADRVSVSNFIDDTGNDPAIAAAMGSNDSVVLDANYDGTHIRAHISPLLELSEVPWTLVVFRDHGLVDRVSSLSTSLSIISWLAITLLLIIVLVAVLGPVRRMLGYSTILPSVLLASVNRKVATIAVAAVLFSLAVFPVLAFQFYFQAQLSKGLSMYLEEESIESIREKRSNFQKYAGELSVQLTLDDERQFLRDSAVGYNKSAENKMIEACLSNSSYVNKDNGRGRSKGFWAFGVFRSLIAYSPTSHAIMRYRAKCDGPDDVDSLPAAFDKVLGKIQDEGEQDEDNSTSLVWIVFTLGIAVLLLFCFLCYSVVRTMFGHAKRIALLPCFCPKDKLDGGKPIRMQLVKRSDRDLDDLIELWKDEFIVKIAKWDDVTQRWNWDIPAESGPDHWERRTIYVVRSLREATQGKPANILADELSQAIQQGHSVVLCSDVVPAYRLSPGTLNHSHETHPTWGNEWDDLTRDFEVRVLCRENSVNNKDQVREKRRSIKELMAAEADANRDLEHVALEVAEQVSKAKEAPNRDGQSTCSELQDKALRQFRAAAQPKFKALWAASSWDERLQLIALARGGAPNIRQSAAISSLANRGLITDHDPIRLRSEAFGQFIKDDLTHEHESLAKWRRQGHGNWWGMTWLPLVVLAGLGLLFFVNSNPEAVATLAAIGAALVGIAPVATSLFRIGQSAPSTSGSED